MCVTTTVSQMASNTNSEAQGPDIRWINIYGRLPTLYNATLDAM